MASGAANYIGDGGMMGAVTRGLGGLSNAIGGGNTAETTKAPEIIDMNPDNFSPTRPVLRPTDGSTTENTGIFDNPIYNAINRGRTYVQNNPFPDAQRGTFPQYAGGYTSSGADNAFLSSAQKGEPNAFINDSAPQFNAQGVQVPFDGGNRIDAPLGIGTLPGKKTLSELAETEPVITAGFSGFNTNMGKPKPFSNTTNQFDPQQRIIDDAKRPLGDRVSMYEDDPSIAFGFGGEPFDLSEGAESISSVSEPVDFPDRGSELGFVERGRDLNRFPPSVSTPGLIGEDMAEQLRREAAEQDENMYGTGMFDLSDSLKTIPAPFGNELGVPVPESTPYGGQEFPLLDSEKPSFPPNQTYYDAFANPYSDAEQANTSDLIDNRAAEQALQDVTNMGSLREEYIPPLAGFGGIRSDENAMSSYSTTPSLPEFSPAPVINQIGNTESQFVSPASPVPSSIVSNTVQNPDGSASTGTLEAVIAAARTNRLKELNVSKLGTATGFENNQVLENARTTEYLDPRIQDAMAPAGPDENMYTDETIFDLSETYNPSGGGFTDGGGGGGGGCPEGYEPMTLENGETVCVPIEEEVTEEEVQEVTPYTPAERPAMGPSAYTPQAVSPIRPYTLQPGEQGVGSLADILQLQNYPNIV